MKVSSPLCGNCLSVRLAFTGAADALGYTQPAVSYQMRTLERAVGAPLTSRYGRRVRLTPVGAALARHAETVLATLRTAQNELASLVSAGGGQVRMSAFQRGCVGLVPAALGRLRRTHPELEVVLTQTECAISHRLVLSGEVDLAVVCDLDDAPNPPDPRLQRIPLLRVRHTVPDGVRGPNHPGGESKP